jgi:hypothetical protein
MLFLFIAFIIELIIATPFYFLILSSWSGLNRSYVGQLTAYWLFMLLLFSILVDTFKRAQVESGSTVLALVVFFLGRAGAKIPIASKSIDKLVAHRRGLRKCFIKLE